MPKHKIYTYLHKLFINVKKKSGIALLSGIVFCLLLSVALYYLFTGISQKQSTGSVPIMTYFHLYDLKEKKGLEKILNEFETIYPAYDIKSVIKPYRDMLNAAKETRKPNKPDIITLSGRDIDMFSTYMSDPRPWTGSL